MTVIYNRRLCVVITDDGDGLIIEDERAPGGRLHVPYGDPELNVDPTDGDIDALP